MPGGCEENGNRVPLGPTVSGTPTDLADLWVTAIQQAHATLKRAEGRNSRRGPSWKRPGAPGRKVGLSAGHQVDRTALPAPPPTVDEDSGSRAER